MTEVDVDHHPRSTTVAPDTAHEISARSTSSNESLAVAHARRLIDDTLAELTYEDAKSARTLAATSVAVSALVAGFFAGEWNPVNLPHIARVVWFGGAIMLIVALAVIGSSAVTKGGPRPRSQEHDLTFYGHAARHANPTELEHALRAARYDDQHDLRRAAIRLWNLSRVLARKKRLLRIGLVVAAFGVIACIAGGLLRGVA